jgi:hypothetical protein
VNPMGNGANTEHARDVALWRRTGVYVAMEDDVGASPDQEAIERWSDDGGFYAPTPSADG